MKSSEERRAGRDARTVQREAKSAERSADVARRRAALAAAKAAQSQPADRFPALGVQIMDDGRLHTFNGIAGRGRILGAAAGAVAEVGNERKSHRVSGAVTTTILTGSPLGLLGAAGKKSKASAFVTLADGTFHERKLEGNGEVSRAHREAARFAAAVMRLEQRG